MTNYCVFFSSDEIQEGSKALQYVLEHDIQKIQMEKPRTDSSTASNLCDRCGRNLYGSSWLKVGHPCLLLYMPEWLLLGLKKRRWNYGLYFDILQFPAEYACLSLCFSFPIRSILIAFSWRENNSWFSKSGTQCLNKRLSEEVKNKRKKYGNDYGFHISFSAPSLKRYVHYSSQKSLFSHLNGNKVIQK